MRVRAKVAVFVENVHRKEGDEFEYNGPPNHNLEPLVPHGRSDDWDATGYRNPKDEDEDAGKSAYAKKDPDEDAGKTYAKKK